MKLEELAIGKSAVILSVGGEGALRQHFLDMGLIPKGCAAAALPRYGNHSRCGGNNGKVCTDGWSYGN